ncbi:hypothetical protein I6A60_38615 [Frankia sp. AgB1.9]|uniref:hypothetical protein n=1 Tax=unclassified Frankia TaxID=2632575 RepID=UPI001934A786|nr:MULTISPECIES: hypothetical protein [unclassified Frankia]MBL7491174.1 hypothetical protein [Frankia sp. AgW1.1]MBL7553703.1 hypothetical protein [Frankia sp. AgB1.9]MBL7618407.1 hypothetical protein [Frankia sp. AgB1.8]
MRLDRVAIRRADNARSTAVTYLPLDDTVTVHWPDGPATYPATQIYVPAGPVSFEPVEHGTHLDLFNGWWSARYHGHGPHSADLHCHDRAHWTVWRIPDAATATQLWNDREKISRVVRDTGHRDPRLTVTYHDDYAAVADYHHPHTFLGAFTYPPGHRHLHTEPRPRHPARTLPEGSRLPLAALPVGAHILTSRTGAPHRGDGEDILVVRARPDSDAAHPDGPAPAVELALRDRAHGQLVHATDEVTVTAGHYVLDHWPHTLPDPAPGPTG